MFYGFFRMAFDPYDTFVKVRTYNFLKQDFDSASILQL